MFPLVQQSRVASCRLRAAVPFVSAALPPDLSRVEAPSSSVLLGESRGGISPPRAPRHVREPLDSYGSRCSAIAIQQAPVSKETRILANNSRKPVPCPLGMSRGMLKSRSGVARLEPVG